MRLILGAVLLTACAPVRPPQAPTYTTAELVERSKASVVHVVAEREDGSGFVVGKDRVATNRRIVANAPSIEVVFADGTRRTVSGVWLAANNAELVVLGVDTGGRAAMALGDSGLLKSGDKLVSLGHGGAFEAVPGPTSAELAHTLAGGPIVNVHGEVMGVHTGAVPGKDGFRLTLANTLVPIAHASTPAQPISALGAPPVPVEPHAADCEAGKVDACAFYRKEAPEKARALLVKACSDRSGPACTLAARMTRDGEGGPANPARAQALFELACERGEADACAEVPKPKAPRRKR